MADSPEKGRKAAVRGASQAWSLHLATVAGVPIRLHATFLILLAWFAMIAIRAPGPDRWNRFVFVAALFACVVLHELGHAVAARRFGIRTLDIVLYPIGGVARLERAPRAYEELWVSAAGPVVSLLLAGAMIGAAVVSGRGALDIQRVSGATRLLGELGVANLVLALFNLLPAFPMDGGRILRALLAIRMGDRRATHIASSIGQVMAFLFGLAAVVTGHLMLLFIAFFVFVGAAQEAAGQATRAAIEGASTRAAMVTDFRTLPAGASLQDAVDLLLTSNQQDFPIVHGSEVIGLLTRQDLLRGLATEGPSGYVAGTMEREFLTVSPDAKLEGTAETMRAQDRSCALVMSDGQLHGLVTTDNLVEYLIVHQVLAEPDTAKPGDAPKAA